MGKQNLMKILKYLGMKTFNEDKNKKKIVERCPNCASTAIMHSRGSDIYICEKCNFTFSEIRYQELMDEITDRIEILVERALHNHLNNCDHHEFLLMLESLERNDLQELSRLYRIIDFDKTLINGIERIIENYQ